ncbi:MULTISPECIES: hypothetical protein [Streptomyces]|jgi:integrase|uniref:hypothetical protein n=1 Tax=Streptomyces TaxID=1883 RepID=UPI0004CD1269|nr:MULTISPECIES: hypothetical protein [Streptomyces]
MGESRAVFLPWVLSGILVSWDFTVAEVFAIADSIAPRYRLLVLLAAFTTLRFGELAALRRRDIDLGGLTVTVRRAQAELQNGRLFAHDRAAPPRPAPHGQHSGLHGRGASTRELMTRMGHSSSRAALIHQHMTSDRDRAIADKLGA